MAKIPLSQDIAKMSDSGQACENKMADIYQAFASAVVDRASILVKTQLEPEDVNINEGKLSLAWSDKAKTFDAVALRAACRCASCISEHTGERLIDDDKIDKAIQIEKVDKMGRYGLKVTFSDGHNTGIYTYSRLKELV